VSLTSGRRLVLDGYEVECRDHFRRWYVPIVTGLRRLRGAPPRHTGHLINSRGFDDADVTAGHHAAAAAIAMQCSHAEAHPGHDVVISMCHSMVVDGQPRRRAARYRLPEDTRFPDGYTVVCLSHFVPPWIKALRVLTFGLVPAHPHGDSLTIGQFSGRAPGDSGDAAQAAIGLAGKHGGKHPTHRVLIQPYVNDEGEE
jgi:hypothetical protein